RFHIDPVLGSVIALPVFFVFGMLVHWVLVRWLPKSDTPTLASLLLMFGFWLVLQNLAYARWGNEDQSILTPLTLSAVHIGDTISIPKVNLVVFAAAVFCMVVLQIVFHRSWFGRSMRALIQNPYAAQIVGVDDEKTARLTFGLGTAFAGFAGGLLGMLFSFSPDFGRPFLLRSFVIIVLGGLESVSGVALGAILLAILETFGINVPLPVYWHGWSFYYLLRLTPVIMSYGCCLSPRFGQLPAWHGTCLAAWRDRFRSALPCSLAWAHIPRRCSCTPDTA